MALTPTARRGLMWIVLPLIALTVLLTALSAVRFIPLHDALHGKDRWTVWVHHGRVAIIRFSPDKNSPIYWGPTRNTARLSLLPRRTNAWARSGSSVYTSEGAMLPIWMLTLPPTLLTLWWVWRRGMFRTPGGCRHCGYDLAGAHRVAGSVCPECGRDAGAWPTA